MDRLKGKVAVIVGATSGIGEAATELFAEEGGRVVFAGRRKENGEPIERRLRERGFDVSFVQTDIKDKEALKALVDTAMDRYGRIDVLFNNAGVSYYYSFLEIPDDVADDILDTNYRSTYRLCKLVAPIMVKQGGGSIINTSSIGGLVGTAMIVPYCGSKGAVRLFSKALAAELGQYGVRVNSLHPGLTLTDMTLKDPAFIEMASQGIPLKRGGDPREIAYGALFLASDESSFMTGSELVIDGGDTGCAI
jgi:NAD(P)-dependent dehydrogenase (short-subunit alcohol dehydrogenase family)